MLRFHLFAVILSIYLEYTWAQKYSTDDLEKFLLDAINSNITEKDFDFGDSTEKPCQPYVPTKPNFIGQGRICEAKCKEYLWELKNRDDENKWIERCRIYLILQIKKGIIPEEYFIIHSPVIFGGRGANPGEFPHMGAVGWRAKNKTKEWIYKCGSTLISENFLLTAGHCTKVALSRATDVVNRYPEVVLLGLQDIEPNEFNIHGTPVLQEIKRIIVHPRYKSPKKYNDIALIEMKTSVKFNENVQPACLWSYPDTKILGQSASLTGWGLTEKGVRSSLLQVAEVDILNNNDCNAIYSNSHNRNWHGFTDTQMCAGKLSGGIDTCQGDSGGPLQVKIQSDTDGKMYMVAGITSFGIKCGLKNQPGIYTRVSSYIDWIEENVWGDLRNASSRT